MLTNNRVIESIYLSNRLKCIYWQQWLLNAFLVSACCYFCVSTVCSYVLGFVVFLSLFFCMKSGPIKKIKYIGTPKAFIFLESFVYIITTINTHDFFKVLQFNWLIFFNVLKWVVKGLNHNINLYNYWICKRGSCTGTICCPYRTLKLEKMWAISISVISLKFEQTKENICWVLTPYKKIVDVSCKAWCCGPYSIPAHSFGSFLMSEM